MPFDFNPDSNEVDTMDGFGEGAGQVEPGLDPYAEAPVPGTPASYVPEVVEQLLNQQEPQEEDYEKVLSQVDRRMRVAHFYRSILDSDLFSEKTSEAKIVQGRIRKFCNDELEVIFGMRAPNSNVVAAQFNEEQVKVLKELVVRLTAAEEAKQSKPVTKPTVNRVATKPAPTVHTIQTQSKPSAPPPRQQPTLQVHAPVQPPPAGKPHIPKVDMRIPERFRNDPTAKVVNGKVYIQNRTEDGELRWVDREIPGRGVVRQPSMKDVTPVAVPTGAPIQPIPMPSTIGGPMSQFSQVMQQHADSTLQALDRAANMPGIGGRVAQQIGGGLVISLLNKQGDQE